MVQPNGYLIMVYSITSMASLKSKKCDPIFETKQ